MMIMKEEAQTWFLWFIKKKKKKKNKTEVLPVGGCLHKELMQPFHPLFQPHSSCAHVPIIIMDQTISLCKWGKKEEIWGEIGINAYIFESYLNCCLNQGGGRERYYNGLTQLQTECFCIIREPLKSPRSILQVSSSVSGKSGEWMDALPYTLTTHPIPWLLSLFPVSSQLNPR